MVLSFSVAYYWDANFGIYSGMQMAQAHRKFAGPEFRPTENFLSENCFTQLSPQTFGLSYLFYYCVKQPNWFILSVLKCKIPKFSGLFDLMLIFPMLC